MWLSPRTGPLGNLKPRHLPSNVPPQQTCLSKQLNSTARHCSLRNPNTPTTPKPQHQLSVEEEKELLKAAGNSVSELLTLSKVYPTNVHFPLAAARLLSKAGRYDEAVLLYRDAEASAPSPADQSFVLVGWATYEMHHGSQIKAEELLNVARAVAPQMAAPLNAMAKLEVRRGNEIAAEDLYRQALDVQPSNFVSAQSLAVLLSKKYDPQASELFERISIAVPSHAPTWQAWALHEWRQGKYSVARDLFEQGIEKCEPHAPLLVAYSKMEAQRRNRTKARALLRQAAIADPSNPHTWVSWAQLEGRLGNRTTAIDICREALKANPGNVFLLCTAGQIYAAAGDIDKAVKSWEEALERDPGCAIAAHELGCVARQQGDLIRAEDFLTLGLGSSDAKGSLRCASALSEIRVFQGDTRAAREVLRSAARRHRPSGRLLREWAGIEKRLGDLSEAAAIYKRAAETDPRDERTWLQWGLLEKRRGEVDAALKCWRAGLKVSPLNPFLWQLCGVTLWDAGRVVAARETFTQALKFCPTNQPLLLEWALKEAEDGDEEAALKILRLAQAAQGAPHAPLLAAWVEFANRLGYTEEATQIKEKLVTSDGCKAASARQKKKQRRAKYFAAKSRGGTV